MGLSIKDNSLDRLVGMLVENTRSVTRAPAFFVEPFMGCLAAISSRANHIVFGRRGSGKTSLLLKAASSIRSRRAGHIVVFVDVEPFKANPYPEVLLSILVQALRGFEDQVREDLGGSIGKKMLRYAREFLGRSGRTAGLAKSLGRISDMRASFEAMLVAEEGVDLSSRKKLRKGMAAKIDSETGVAAKLGSASISFKVDGLQAEEAEAETEILEKATRRKIDFLLRRTVDLRGLIAEVARCGGGSSFIFLDDLYHIRRADQVHVVDYFHRITKGSECWLKIGTIRHRSSWYMTGDPSRGMKIGDDCGEINLDVPLSRREETREFLVNVVAHILPAAGISNYQFLLSEAALLQLIFASGGVVRDLISILRGAILVARKRAGLPGLIQVEEINQAAFSIDDLRREELKRDTFGHQHIELAEYLARLKSFCFAERSNLFLVEWEGGGTSFKFEELVDMRFVHLVQEGIPASEEQPEAHRRMYVLDLSQCNRSEWRNSVWLRNPIEQGATVDFNETPVWRMNLE